MDVNFKKVFTRPDELVPGTIYFIDDEKSIVISGINGIYEYDNSPKIEEEIKKLVGDTDKEITLAGLLEKINKLADTPFEGGEGENSAVQKGGNNASIAKLSSAKGLNNSSLGWYSNSEGYSSTSISEHLDIEALDQYTPEYSESRTEEIKNLIYDTYIYSKAKVPSGDDLFSAAYGLGSHTEGRNGLSLGQRAHTEGLDNIGYGHNSHAEGQGNEAKGNNSHAEGYSNVSEGRNSHAEGNHNIASGENSHAEGSYMISDGKASHAEGLGTEKYEYGAFGNYSHHEGGYNKVTNSYAHGEGANNEANGLASHVEGRYNIADGHFSHSEGKYTQTTTDAEHAQGIYNLSNEKTIHSVGIGDKNERKNAHEIMQDGKHYIYDIGGYKGTNPTDDNDLATVINNKADKNELDGLSKDMDVRIAKLVGSAPETLDTLSELADAIQENDNVIEILNAAITNKVDKVEDQGLSTNDYTNEDKNKLSLIEEGAQKNVTPDWNASEGESGFIKSRTHYVSGAHSIPFEYWNKSIDENGDAIYSYFAGYDLCYGCIIQDGNYVFGEENYIFFETEWVSLFPDVSANIRINYDSEVGDSVLEIKLHQDADPEEYLANFINNALFAYGQGEDFIYPIAKEFIPNTIARQESVDELREETTALWENLDHGVFPNLVAGDLAGRGESVPASFGFRASGGKSIKDGRAYIKRIKGNSVVWNQLLQNDGESATINGVTITKVGKEWHCSGVATADVWFLCSNLTDVMVGHKYLYQGCPNGGSTTTYMLWEVSNHLNVDEGKGSISTANVNGISPYIVICKGVDATGLVYKPTLTDLTKMFQAGNEPTTIEEFNARVATLGIDMYAYNEGQVIHCNTESIKSIGDNAFDGNLEFGKLDNSGQNGTANNMLRCVNYVRILPNEEYYMSAAKYMNSPVYCYPSFYDENYNFISKIDDVYNTSFITPSNAAYLRFYLYTGAGLGLDYDGVMITLVHSGWKQDTDAGYQPYWQDILPLPIVRKYFPQGMKKAGSAHDEIRYNKASGKWEYSKGKIKSVDLGTLGWSYNSTSGQERFFTIGIKDVVAQAQDSMKANLVTSRYITDSFSSLFAHISDKLIAQHSSGQVVVYDSAYTDAASFKAMLQEKQVKLYYESNDWEWEELDAEDQNFRDYYKVADFGTEQAISNTPSAAFSADIIYQFNAVDMIREHEVEINELKKGTGSYDDTELRNLIANKVDKVNDKGLSTNDYTDEDKEKLSSVEEGAQKNISSDWNAQEGEAGYIKNRTHYLERKLSYTLGKGVTKISYDYVKAAHFDNTIIEMPPFEDGLEISIVSGPPIYLKYIYEDDNLFIELIDNYSYFENKVIEFYQNVQPIELAYIPNTVIKTTPQTLTDTDKNQALANLGIADLLEALKPVQLSSAPLLGNVTQEQLDEIGLTEKVVNNIVNGYTNRIYITGSIFYVIYVFADNINLEFTIANYIFNSSGYCDTLLQYKCVKTIDGFYITKEEI